MTTLQDTTSTALGPLALYRLQKAVDLQVPASFTAHVQWRITAQAIGTNDFQPIRFSQIADHSWPSQDSLAAKGRADKGECDTGAHSLCPPNQ